MWQQRACNARNANKKQAGQSYERKSMNSIKYKCKKKEWKKLTRRPAAGHLWSSVHPSSTSKTSVISVEKGLKVLKGFLRTTCSQFLWMIKFWNKMKLDKNYQLRLRLFACWGWSGALWEPATIANSTDRTYSTFISKTSFGAVDLSDFNVTFVTRELGVSRGSEGSP